MAALAAASEEKLRDELALLRERNREENAQIRQEIERLKRELASVQAFITDLPPLSITVDHYDSLKKNSGVYTSRAFYTHPRGYKMCIKIWPNGVFDGKK